MTLLKHIYINYLESLFVEDWKIQPLEQEKCTVSTFEVHIPSVGKRVKPIRPGPGTRAIDGKQTLVALGAVVC